LPVGLAIVAVTIVVVEMVVGGRCVVGGWPSDAEFSSRSAAYLHLQHV